MYRTCIFQAGRDEGIATLMVTAFQQIDDGKHQKTITKSASINIWVVPSVKKRSRKPPLGDRPPSLDEIALSSGIHSKYLPDTNIVQVNNQHKDYLESEKKGAESLHRYLNYCYCKEIAIDRWKDLTTDPHELSERITDLLAMSELAFDWKELAPPQKKTKSPQRRNVRRT